MPRAFITHKTKSIVELEFGGVISGGIIADGFDIIIENQKFFNWTFDQLQKTDETSIIYDEGV